MTRRIDFETLAKARNELLFAWLDVRLSPQELAKGAAARLKLSELCVSEAGHRRYVESERSEQRILAERARPASFRDRLDEWMRYQTHCANAFGAVMWTRDHNGKDR